MNRLTALLKNSKIGDIIQIDITLGDEKANIKAKVTRLKDCKTSECDKCIFHRTVCMYAPCTAGCRKDGKDVYYKKIK